MPQKHAPAPRSLQEWMERHAVNGERLRHMVLEQTGHSISATMLSWILRGSRRCSAVNALALHTVTKVPFDTLRKWPPSSDLDKVSGKRQKSAA